MKQFYNALVNALIANTTNNFVWFTLVFWVYLQTKSVIATSIIGASYFIFNAGLGLLFGTFVDTHRKQTAIRVSSVLSLVFFALASSLFLFFSTETLTSFKQVPFWLLVGSIMGGAVAGNLRMITLSTLVSMIVPKKNHAHANGLIGIVNGVSFSITSVFSGLAVAYLGMQWSLLLGTGLTILVAVHAFSISFNEKKPSTKASKKAQKQVFDLHGAVTTIAKIPGLGGLIFFTMLNNFFGGVFMALSDPYGLELVSVETWGFIWGGLSLFFILGGVLVSKFGLTKNPLKLMFLLTTITWIAGMIFPLQPSIWLFAAGMVVYMVLIPAIEAAEQTVLQRVVPPKKQGRVFGFAQTVESLATPVMSLSIGPITELYFIPYMTTGTGVDLIGSWFGTGINRGIGLVFIISSFFGLILTLMAFNSKMYTLLLSKYKAR